MNTRNKSIISLLRLLADVCVIAALVAWALTSPPFGLPGLLAAALVLVAAVLYWALFLSPRAVLHTDRFGRSLVGLVFVAAGCVAAVASGLLSWLPVAIFGVAAAIFLYLEITLSHWQKADS
ncbi:MAG: DUF2568 domain-containing protein [Microbacteriaceae bacterium]|nr:DUF2568 domain-containing protein [Microbacteriaceae bacterium]